MMVKNDFIKIELEKNGLFRVEILSQRTFSVDSIDIMYCTPDTVGETVQEMIDLYTTTTNNHDGIYGVNFKVQ